MPTTPEDRIRAQYKGYRRRWDPRNESFGMYWLLLARQWRRPVQEIKRIVRAKP